MKKFLMLLCALTAALSANAGMISTQDLYAQQLRGQIVQQLDHPALIEAMQAQGISRAEAERRINSLTPAELSDIGQQLNNAPAGEGVITFLIIGFAILVVTDAMGYTDLFPFVKGPED